MLCFVGPRPGGPRSWAKTLGLFLKTVKKESGPEGQGLKGKLIRLCHPQDRNGRSIGGCGTVEMGKTWQVEPAML